MKMIGRASTVTIISEKVGRHASLSVDNNVESCYYICGPTIPKIINNGIFSRRKGGGVQWPKERNGGRFFMRCDSYLQFRIVSGQTFAELTEQLNKAMYELRQKDPEVEFEGLTARIRYSESEYTPEDLREEYSLKGVDLHCVDCPFFEPLRNKNGSINRAAKRGDCPFTEYGTTFRDALACERFFKMLNNGDLRVVKGEEVEEC